MADYRIVKKTNGLGAVMWAVQRHYRDGWWDLINGIRSPSSARRAMRKLERRDRATTWVVEEVD